jgi:hypothetical protein
MGLAVRSALSRFAATLYMALFLAACRHRTLPSADTADIRVEEYTVTYKGQRLTLGAPLAEWQRAFGEPSRYVDRDDGIQIWDHLGLAVSLRTPFPAGDPRVVALRIFFTQRDVDFWPRHAYAGSVVFVQEGEEPGQPNVVTVIDAKTTSSELIRQHVSARYGFPGLSNYTRLRFIPHRVDEVGLELFSVEIGSDSVLHPWNGHWGRVVGDAGASTTSVGMEPHPLDDDSGAPRSVEIDGGDAQDVSPRR